MIKQIAVFVAGVLCVFHSAAIAQDEMAEPKTKKINHYVGVQVNELVRQVFNFNGSSNNLNNPYLVMYSLNLAKSGWGVRLGFGPEFNTFKDDDGITIREINIINARLGIEKAFRLSDKWSAGAGLDGVYSSDITFSKTAVRSFDSTNTNISSHLSSMGGGAMAWLRYSISPRIQVGTEASFYYRVGKFKQKVDITRRVSNINGTPKYETTYTTLDNKLKEGKFNLPMVFYLIVSF